MENNSPVLAKQLAATVSLENSRREWASLPFLVIDELLRVLKRTRRWRLDGRSLRLLNRHWSQAVSRSVHEIRPHFLRVLADEDVSSLLKFPNATSLDISPFLIAPPKHALPRRRREKSCFLSTWYGRQMQRMADVLCQLTHLYEIEASWKALIILYHQCTGTNANLARIGGIASLYCYYSKNLRLYGRSPFNTTWVHQFFSPHKSLKPIEAFVGCFILCNTVEIEERLLRGATSLHFLEKYETVRVQGMRLSTWKHLLSKPLSKLGWMRELDDMHPDKSDLIQLDSSGKPGLSVTSLSGVSHVTDTPVACRLQSFSLCFIELTGSFAYLEKLECLCLEECCFDGRVFRGNLPRLRILRVERADVSNGDTSFLTQFHKLEALAWVDVKTPRKMHHLQVPLDRLVLPKLRSLSASLIISDHVLEAISERTNLEVLSMHILNDPMFDKDVTRHGIQLLERLQCLRVFRIASWRRAASETCVHLVSLSFVAKLEQLWVELPQERPPNLERLLGNIQRVVPQLIVEGEYRHIRFCDWSSKFFRHAYFL